MDVTKDYSTVICDDKEEKLVSDWVIVTLGTKVNTDAIDQLKSAVNEYYIVGDCNGTQGLWNATTSAFDAAMVI